MEAQVARTGVEPVSATPVRRGVADMNPALIYLNL